MATSPGSGIKGAITDAMRDMLAGSATWQSWTGTANATDAKAYIHDVAVAESDAALPLCIIEPGDAIRRRDGNGLWTTSGEIDLHFYGDVTESAIPDAFWEFQNQLDGVVQDLTDASESDGGLFVTEVDMGRPARLATDGGEQDEAGNARNEYFAHVRLTFGAS